MAGTDGRLIRVAKYRGDPKPAAYVVAVSDKETALNLIRENIGQPGYDIEDLGNVSEQLLTALALAPGSFARIDGLRHVSQQQQQPQPDSPTKQGA
jgi:hypothetical protein